MTSARCDGIIARDSEAMDRTMKKSTIFMLLLAMALVRKGYERFFIDRTGSGAFSVVPQDHNNQINAEGFFRTWEGLSETQLINTRDEAIGPVYD